MRFGRADISNFLALQLVCWRCCLLVLALGRCHVQALIDVVLELFESDKDNRKIIDAVAPGRNLNDLIADHTANLVQGRWLHPRDAEMPRALESRDIPNDLIDLVVLKLVKNPVRSDNDVIEGVRGIGFSDDLRQASYTVLNAAVGRDLCLCIAERSTDAQSAREDSVRADEGIFFILAVVLRRLLNLDLVNHIGRHAILDNCLGLIDVSASLNQSIKLRWVRRLVIMADLSHFRAEALPLLDRLAADSPRVPHVDYIHEIINHQHHDRARATLIHALVVLKSDLRKKFLFCLLGSVLDS